jgi:hypothetical protein
LGTFRIRRVIELPPGKIIQEKPGLRVEGMRNERIIAAALSKHSSLQVFRLKTTLPGKQEGRLCLHKNRPFAAFR